MCCVFLSFLFSRNELNLWFWWWNTRVISWVVTCLYRWAFRRLAKKPRVINLKWLLLLSFRACMFQKNSVFATEGQHKPSKCWLITQVHWMTWQSWHLNSWRVWLLISKVECSHPEHLQCTEQYVRFQCLSGHRQKEMLNGKLSCQS